MLSDDEQKIMFGVFGMDEKQKDVAGEVGRKPQSVSRSIDRIMKRLEKELAEKLGYHGEDRSKE
jgi:DNA-directed RNA polymerase specialized sigma subunit